MKRRKFIKISSLATLPVLLKSCNWAGEGGLDLDITVHTDIHTGHVLFESQSYTNGENLRVETLIVGGGVAGLAAAYHLKESDFLLCELSDRLGGTSSFHHFDGLAFAQGAHYDLAYPANYGEEVLAALESLGIIEYQHWKDAWSFKDRQHIIMHRRKNRCFDNGEFRGEVLKAGALKKSFDALMGTYSGAMKMPVRLMDPQYHALDQVTFYDFLKDQIELTEDFARGLDYHMRDDYGGTIGQVSALAGIHYFACRPYYKEVVDLFSPPEGNGYFIQKMAEKLPKEQLWTQHLIKSIRPVKYRFEVDVVDIGRQQVKTIQADRIIYAGQKHALKYILPEEYPLFEKNIYAPWLVLNFIIDNQLEEHGFWQNEMLTDDPTFMGFVDSNAQHRRKQRKRVLTAYYCLPPASRNDLRNVEANKEAIAEKTLKYLNLYFGKDISGLVEKVFIKVMGHAMPIPVPGYLFNSEKGKYANLAYAGVDNGRLPLLFEAMDSGIEAAQRVRSR